ncbi:MAG: tripartite tricarboxylate transporter TctB family protein [Spirochaetales bacterium]|nr:tripartite tricarboxylate transporter TctB family protein [Spirochaetales bacterium]
MMKTIKTLTASWDAFLDHCAGLLEGRTLKLYPGPAGSVLFLAIGALILVLMPTQINVRTEYGINARTFPSMLAWIMIAGALINLMGYGIKILQKSKPDCIELDLLTEVKALILLLFLVLFAVLMPLVGFSIASVIYSILMLLFFRIKDWKYYLLVTFLALGIGFLFKNLLNVRLP